MKTQLKSKLIETFPARLYSVVSVHFNFVKAFLIDSANLEQKYF